MNDKTEEKIIKRVYENVKDKKDIPEGFARFQFVLREAISQTKAECKEKFINWIKKQNCYRMGHILDSDLKELKKELQKADEVLK